MKHVKAIMLFLSFSTLFSSCAYYQVTSPSNPKFKELTTSGDLRVDMTEQEVRKLLGNPKEIGTRQTIYDTRSVWTYKEYVFWENPAWHPIYLAGCAFTYGLVCLMPAPAENHYVIFSDGRVLGWDSKDPYAPDLIIERRERTMPSIPR